MNKKVLITGSAGFIGYHLCKSFLKDDFDVLGVDNINDYYDIKLKIARTEKLKSFNNFNFKKIDMTDRSSLTKAFNSFAHSSSFAIGNNFSTVSITMPFKF